MFSGTWTRNSLTIRSYFPRCWNQSREKIESKNSDVHSKLKSLKSKAELIGMRLEGFDDLDDLGQRILDYNDAKQKRSIELHGVRSL
jgi:hypothetical protein